MKFTFCARAAAYACLTMAMLAITSLTIKSYAQLSCTNENVLFTENFGTGTTATSSPDIVTTGLTFQATGSLHDEGTYRIINSTQQKVEWHVSEDHTTGDINGKMLVANGQAETFYSHQVNHQFRSRCYTLQVFF